MGVQQEVLLSVGSFDRYQESKRLPEQFFKEPDYLSLTVSGIDEFDQIVNSYSNPEKVLVIEEDDRFIARIKLGGAIAIGNLGVIRWLEIKEPTACQLQLQDIPNRYLAFHFPEIYTAMNIFDLREVLYLPDSVEGRHSLEVTYESSTIGDNGFRLSSKKLEETIDGLAA